MHLESYLFIPVYYYYHQEQIYKNIEMSSNLELLFHIRSQEVIKKPGRVETLEMFLKMDVIIIHSNG